MNDHIHTIPVLDALREPGGCPFCAMHEKLDRDAVSFILGPAYMDETVRTDTNRAGFCAAHTAALFKEQNRLGLALLLHTHLKQIIKDTDALVKDGLPLPGFMKPRETASDRLSKHIGAQQDRCYLCERIDNTFTRYMDTFFYLWTRDSEMAALVKALPGFCLPHYADMLKAAGKSLDKRRMDSFLEAVIPLQQRYMKEMEADLDWFVQKFDYRNADAPWKNAKDALPRVMALLNGKTGGNSNER